MVESFNMWEKKILITNTLGTYIPPRNTYLIKYLVGKLSLPSTMTSQCCCCCCFSDPPLRGGPFAIIDSAVWDVNSVSYNITLQYGLISWIRIAADWHFDTPTVDVPCIICRCKFETSTVSLSIIPIVPIHPLYLFTKRN